MAWTTLQNVFDDVRYRTATGTTSTDTGVVSDATLLRVANKYYRKIMQAFADLHEDFFGEIGTFDLKSSAVTTLVNEREYTLPADSGTSGGGALSVLHLEAQIDGTNWRVLEYMPIHKIPVPISPTASEANITSYFSNSAPKYTIFDNSFFILSGTVSTVTSGGRIMYIKRTAELSAVGNVLGDSTYKLPNEFLYVLSDGMCADIFERFGQSTQQQNSLALFETGLLKLKTSKAKRSEESEWIIKPYPIKYS